MVIRNFTSKFLLNIQFNLDYLETGFYHYTPTRVNMTKSASILRAMAIYRRKLERQKNQKVYVMKHDVDK